MNFRQNPIEITLLLILFIAASLCASAHAENLNLSVGQKYRWSPPAGATAHLKGSHVVQLADQGKDIEITGVAPGQAHISAGAKSLNIFVSPAAGTNLLSALQKKTRQMLGLSAQMINGQVTVSGRLHRLSDWQDLAAEAKDARASYAFAARIDDDIKADVLKFLRQTAAAENLPPPNFIFAPAACAIIPEENKSMSAVWDDLLSPFGICRRYEKSDLAIKPLIRVNIVVAEVNRTQGQQLGIEWPESADAQLTDRFSGPAQVLFTLHALEKAGLGNILASPNLLARSGAEAEFLAGGELPIRVANRWIHDVVWKRHGIYLKIKPSADYYGRLSIELTTEVSLPDKVYDGIPSLKTDRMSTHFDLPEARTIILSGLIRHNWDESTAGLPWLSRIPVLGLLFSSKDYTSQRTELVVFVTPEIVKTQEPSAPIKMPKGWRDDEAI